jgi:internalin A
MYSKIHNSFTKPEVTEWVPVPGYPTHPPLDYQELLGLEAMGEREYPIGKLRIKVNLRQLLDGYEPIEARQRHRMDEFPDGFNISIINNNQQGNYKHMAETTNNFQGANIANLVNEVKDNAQATASASNFNQTSGASIPDLLQIITAMRLCVKQPPNFLQRFKKTLALILMM